LIKPKHNYNLNDNLSKKTNINSRKVFILLFCLFSFVFLWLNHIQSNCNYIFNAHKLQNIICSVVRTNVNDIKIIKLENSLSLELKSALQTSLENKQKLQDAKNQKHYANCSFCMGLINLSDLSYQQIFTSLSNLNHILVISSSFIQISVSLDKLWFMHKAHSPPNII
jgi:hypothetical protein